MKKYIRAIIEVISLENDVIVMSKGDQNGFDDVINDFNATT